MDIARDHIAVENDTVVGINEPSQKQKLKESGADFLSYGKNQIAKEFESLSYAIHGASDRLHEKNDTVAIITDRIASSIDSAALYVKEHSSEEIVNDLNGYAKRNPLMILGGMFLAGLAVSRFFKAGAESKGGTYELGK